MCEAQVRNLFARRSSPDKQNPAMSAGISEQPMRKSAKK
jgi:hypothetical protein